MALKTYELNYRSTFYSESNTPKLHQILRHGLHVYAFLMQFQYE